MFVFIYTEKKIWHKKIETKKKIRMESGIYLIINYID